MTTLSNRLAALPVARRRVSFAQWIDLARQRRALAQLDDARLHDLGLTRREAIQEARRPIWDRPAQWQKI